MVLLMVGPVGSGKSTFAGRLIQQGQAQWVRVNQVIRVLPDSCQALSNCPAESLSVVLKGLVEVAHLWVL